MTIDRVKKITLPKITDNRGTLTFLESNHHLPFDIKRVFYLYDLTDNTMRANHAHKTTQEFLVCLQGSFKVIVSDGQNQCQFTLNSPDVGLYIPPLIWVKLSNFLPNSLCLAMADQIYNKDDYYRDYQEYCIAVNQ